MSDFLSKSPVFFIFKGFPKKNREKQYEVLIYFF